MVRQISGSADVVAKGLYDLITKPAKKGEKVASDEPIALVVKSGDLAYELNDLIGEKSEKEAKKAEGFVKKLEEWLGTKFTREEDDGRVHIDDKDLEKIAARRVEEAKPESQKTNNAQGNPQNQQGQNAQFGQNMFTNPMMAFNQFMPEFGLMPGLMPGILSADSILAGLPDATFLFGGVDGIMGMPFMKLTAPRLGDSLNHSRPSNANYIQKAKAQELASKYGSKYGVDPKLIMAVIQRESSFNANVTSPKDCRGLMQISDANAAKYGASNPYDPEQNVNAGVQYLKHLLDRFKGNVTLAVAAYHSGPGAVDDAGGVVPPGPKVQQYVQDVMRIYQNQA